MAVIDEIMGDVALLQKRLTDVLGLAQWAISAAERHPRGDEQPEAMVDAYMIRDILAPKS